MRVSFFKFAQPKGPDCDPGKLIRNEKKFKNLIRGVPSSLLVGWSHLGKPDGVFYFMALLKIQRFFGAVPNELLNNPDISFKAKGLYAYLNSKPDNWDFSVERIAAQVKEGIDSVRAGIQELEKTNYLKRIKYQNEKGFWEIDYMLFENPMEGESYLGKSDEGKHPKQYKKEYTKKENRRKEEIDNDLHEKIQAIIARINQHAGTSFRADTKESARMISARLKTYSLDDALRVVDTMAGKWLKTDMRQHYVPTTLFRESNFEKYLQMAGSSMPASNTPTANNPDFKLGKFRYRPQSEFGSYTQYLKNCEQYGHTPTEQGHD